MAVIRTARMFVAYVGETDSTPEPVWTCPAGYRAIFRQFTCVLGSNPIPGSQPYWSVVLLKGVDRFWLYLDSWNEGFTDPSKAPFEPGSIINAMFVCYPNERIGIQNATGGHIYVSGSGHMLPDPS